MQRPAAMPLLSRYSFILLSVSILPVLALWFYTKAATQPILTRMLSDWLPAAATQSFCLPPGPLLPPPTLLPTSPKLEIPIPTSKYPLWISDTSYAIKASVGNVTIFEHEHSAHGREVGQSLLNTSLRIGSVTKTFTILAVLLSKNEIKLSDPITKFIPELEKEVYEEITIAALASHTSGLGRYVYVGDLAVVPGFQPAALGLPNIDSSGGIAPICDPFPGGRICTRAEVLAGLNNPAYYPRSPHSGPLYSNIGYNLLGMALEVVHNKSYEQVVHDLIIEPLGLGRTSFSVPTNASTALLPRSVADRGWFVPDFGNYNPSGGLWSTPNDLTTFLQSILSHKLLSQHETRRWLQPRALLPSLHQAVGESWEILRPADIDVKTPRPIEIFTKTGGVTGYAAYTAIIPEYNIALTIHAAGGQANKAVSTLFPLIVKPIVTYADKLVQEQVAVEYAGTYKAITAESTDRMNLAVDGGPGLAVTDWTIDGIPVLRSLAAMQKIPYNSISARLYPVDQGSLGTVHEAWRILIDRRDVERDFAELQCVSWNLGDSLRYFTEPLDMVIFTKGVGGAMSVELLGWRVRLQKL